MTPATMRTLMSSENMGWETPDNVLRLVREVFGGDIELDPCTTIANPTKAHRIFTPVTNGLAQAWGAGTYLNPPYNREIGPWMAKASVSAINGSEVLALVPARTDTAWWQTYVTTANAVCFWRGRLTFRGAPAPAPFPSALPYWGPHPLKFAQVFGRHGWVVNLGKGACK
jgi:hypothetical protein